MSKLLTVLACGVSFAFGGIMGGIGGFGMTNRYEVSMSNGGALYRVDKLTGRVSVCGTGTNGLFVPIEALCK